ncbi:MAG: PEP-utilizing protein mobile subunit [Oscillibacter sp.]|nr:PEP-utilizing protein mobile subunit [Oscillibacter sp.]
MSDTSKVLATKFTDERFPIEWKDEAEKSLMWFYDDLHCPNPISPLYFDIGGWWDTEGRWGSDCTYMYQRFGAPIGKAWIAKKIGGYVYSAVVPPEMDADKIGPMFDYYTKVMPIYADTFMDRWNKEYVPRLLQMHKAMLDFDFEHRSLPEIMIHMEDILDMKCEAFRIHWIINLAQFQASTNFTNVYEKVMGKVDPVEIGKINVSPKDRNWDSLKALWEMKEYVCSVPALKELFLSGDAAAIMAKAGDAAGGSKLLEMVNDYREEYGFKAMYTHEFIYKTWYEDPTPIYEAVRGYVANDYDFKAEYDACMTSQKEAIDGLYARVSDPALLAELKYALELCVKMAPLTPDHHFYIDQGVYSHMRVAFVRIGEAMVRAGILDGAEDIFMLKYDEIRCACASSFPVKELVKTRRAEMEAARKIHPQEWYGTATEWQVYNEPYKSLWGYPQKFEAEQQEKAGKAEISKTVLKGIPGCPGCQEGVAHLVSDPSELDTVKEGEILVCKMTNPAWVVSFSKISALVTDTGGALSHPAVVAREFGVPCVVGTRRATQLIQTGDRIRVDGSKGVVEVTG